MAPPTPRPTLRLRNTATRRVDPFHPADPRNVRLYLCGPTVYDRAHLGNARNVILFDVLARLLRRDYGADHVTYVRNVTDVDDKINARAAREGRPIRDVTEETLGWFHDDMASLGNLPPDHEPRATDHVPQMIDLVATLIDRGHAYAAEGHVLFAVASYPEYGALSGRSVEDMVAGARVEVAPYKRDPMDFVLWKPSAEDEPGWDSPWGRGRPGWHLECSAMSRALLGEAVDIHGGGNDLLFPHHENEVAQSRCAHPGEPFARHWLHNEMLLVDGRKMSKSLGNFFTVRDLLDRGVPGEVIRFVFLMTHYAKPMDWTEAKVAEAAQTLRLWHSLTDDVQASEPDDLFLDRLRDDLNTPGALARLHQLAKRRGPEELKASASLLGLLEPAFKRNTGTDTLRHEMISDLRRLHSAWADHRRAKDWSHADGIRGALEDIGIKLRQGDETHSDWVIPDLDVMSARERQQQTEAVRAVAIRFGLVDAVES